MDAQTFTAIVGMSITLGTAIVIVTVYAVTTRGKTSGNSRDIVRIDAVVHKHANRLALIPEKPDDIYARKETITPQLDAVRQSLERIEERQSKLVDRLMGPGAA